MRIAIVNDTKMCVEVLVQILATQPFLKVAWIAYNGAEAVKKCAEDTPDLILMDLIMPVMDGVSAIRKIMMETPCPILLVTSTIKGNQSLIYQAMGCGALDVVSTPELDLSVPSRGGKELLRKIEIIIQLKGYRVAKPSKSNGFHTTTAAKVYTPPLLVIGSSTGGPKALSTILSNFTTPMPFATVIIQHVDEKFAEGLSKWLASQTKHLVSLAFEGQKIKPGAILMAGKNDHLVLTESLSLKYSAIPAENPYRPSVDEFFFSVAKYWPKKSVVGALLTGMGSDGAIGLKELRNRGWQTIAEDESSCVVFGMPKSAIEIEAATHVLPINEIGPCINKLFQNLE